MLVQACLEANFDGSTGTCSAPFWTAPPGFFSGWTPDDLGQLVAAVLATLAIAYVIRLIHVEASRL